LVVVYYWRYVNEMVLRAFRGRLPFTLIRAFCCYVRPILEYASPVWNPYLVKDVKIVEMVQKSFTRRVFAKCGLPKRSYEERLVFFCIDSLQTRRVKCDLVYLHKMSKGTVDLSLYSFFPDNKLFLVELVSDQMACLYFTHLFQNLML
jgi:hypothetical protein